MHRPVPRPDLGLGRGLDRRLLRTPERSEEQGLVKGREQRPEQMLFRATGQGLEQGPLPRPRQAPVRGLVLGLERGPGQRRGQCLLPALLSWPARPYDQGLLRGEGLPEPTGEWLPKKAIER